MPDEFAYDVFLSHSSRDKEIVRELAERLRGDGLRVWFDDGEIQEGNAIPNQVLEGLAASRRLVAFLSANQTASDWSQLEVGAFLASDPLNKRGRILPLRLDDGAINGALGQFRLLDWRPGKRAGEYDRLLEVCREPLDAPQSAKSKTQKARVKLPRHQPVSKPLLAAAAWMVLLIVLALAMAIGALAYTQAKASPGPEPPRVLNWGRMFFGFLSGVGFLTHYYL